MQHGKNLSLATLWVFKCGRIVLPPIADVVRAVVGGWACAGVHVCVCVRVRACVGWGGMGWDGGNAGVVAVMHEQRGVVAMFGCS